MLWPVDDKTRNLHGQARTVIPRGDHALRLGSIRLRRGSDNLAAAEEEVGQSSLCNLRAHEGLISWR